MLLQALIIPPYDYSTHNDDRQLRLATLDTAHWEALLPVG